MPWAKVDDTFYDHPKVEATSSRALATYLLALSWCNRFLTDGLVPASCLRKLRGTKAVADELVTHGLWERAGEDYRVHDFLKYNKSKSQVESARDRWAESKRESRTRPTAPFPSRTHTRSSSRETESAGEVLRRLARESA